MLTVREVLKQTLTDQYEGTIGPFRDDLRKLMKEASVGALKALALTLKAMQKDDPEHLSAPIQNLVIAAGMDLAEKEDFVLGNGDVVDLRAGEN
jgi:hypothetical protein